MIVEGPLDIATLFAEGDLIDDALTQAGRDARLKHKLLGVPIVVWRDGQIVEIPPEEIVVDPPEVDGSGDLSDPAAR